MKAGTLWNGGNTFADGWEALWKKLVPLMGSASTEHGEALRTMSRIYYDVYNNGGCNLGSQYMLGHTILLLDWMSGKGGRNALTHVRNLVQEFVTFEESTEWDNLEAPTPLQDHTFLQHLEDAARAVYDAVRQVEALSTIA